MEGDARVTLVVSLFLLAATALFVAAEYGLIGSRRTRIEALAKKGNKNARLVQAAYARLSTYVAGIQNGITICGIAVGAVTEPTLTKYIEPGLSFLPGSVIRFLSILLVTLPLVTVGELVPKYLSLRHPERMALVTIRPLRFVVGLMFPLVWVTQKAGELLMKPFGVNMGELSESAASREEFALMVQASHEEGHFEEAQANVINKALKFDTLDAADVMIHRLDIRWIDKSADRAAVSEFLKVVPHSRVPVCEGDIDEVVGIAYLQDILRAWEQPGFSLASVLRPAVFVPENLTLDRVVQRMREDKTQILLVRDEYGGTAGLLTLEDVVEEVFGELEDSLESERPPIERVGPARVTARADVRYDELLEFLDFDGPDATYTTETLAEIIANGLERSPRLGDSVEVPIGTLRVENMAQSRMTRIVLIQDARPTPGAPG